MSKRETFIDNLRALASWLEAHPAIPVPEQRVCINVFDLGKPALQAAARTAAWEKVYVGDFFVLRRTWDAVRYDLNGDRAAVCRRVVTGTRVVPAQPARTVDMVEWQCDEPLLETVQ